MSAGADTSPVFSYTSLDFASMKADLESYAQSTFPAALWTDFNSSDPGVYLIESMSYLSDLLAYGLNSYAHETVLVTAVKRQNFINIAQSLDYTLASASASSGQMSLVFDPGGAYPVTISSHLQLTDPSGTYYFQPVTSDVVASYPGSIDVPIVNGREYFEENIGITNGQPSQQFQLQNSPLIDRTLSLTINNVPYSLVDNAISASPTAKTYTVKVNENNVVTITMGDAINGTIPPTGQNAKATYKVGGGLATNLAAGVALSIVGTSDNSPVPTQVLSATVESGGPGISGLTGGGDEESLAVGQQNAPLSLKANFRAVAVGDYAALAVSQVPSVFQATTVPGIPYAGARPALLIVVPQGGGLPSDNPVLINQIQQAFIPFKTPGKRIIVTDPVYVQLLIGVDAFIQGNSSALQVATRVRTTLNNVYSLANSTFAETIDLQSAYAILQPTTISGLDHALYITFSIIPYYAAHLQHQPVGNGVIEDITTNESMRREWLCRVVPADPTSNIFCLRFEVWERQLGTVTFLTDTLLVDSSANFTAGSLVGNWFVRPNPDLNSSPSPTEPTDGILLSGTGVTYDIISNSTTTITVAPPGGLLAQAAPGDPYVVEYLNARVGKVLRTTLTAGLTGGTTLAVASSLSFLSPDKIIVHSPGTTPQITTVVSIPNTTSIVTNDPITNVIGAFVDFYWTADNGTVSFSMINGTTSFIAGDELYVDTYPATGDLNLRPENFPLISDSNISINTIGGV